MGSLETLLLGNYRLSSDHFPIIGFSYSTLSVGKLVIKMALENWICGLQAKIEA